MDSPTSDLKRDDALRKSIKKNKAPLSPAPVRLADIDIGERPPLSLSPITAAAPPFKLFPSPLPKPRHFQVSTNFDSDKRSSVPAHMLANVKISANDAKNRLFTQEEIDDRSDPLDLDSIQKQINAVEEIFHQQQLQSELESSHRKTSIEELKIRSRRYGETENLLQPCGSNMASGTDFCYLPPMNDSDCEEEGGFQRGSEGRNSTGAKDFEKSAKNSKINRTSSDTKNFDYVGIRQTLREKQVQKQQQQQQSTESVTKRKDVKELDDLLAKAAAKHNKRIPVPVDEVDNGVSEMIVKPSIPTANSIILKRNEAKYAQNLRHFEDSIKKAKLAAQAEGKNKAKTAAPPVVTAVTPKVSKVPLLAKPTAPSPRRSISPPPVPPSNNSTLPTRNNRLASAQAAQVTFFCFVKRTCGFVWRFFGVTS